ncbi:MAG: LysM domain, partial [Chloroflexota bacterium]
FGLRQAEPGDCSGEAIPVPIPNTEVKLSSAENTEGAAPRQNRSSPGSLASWGGFVGYPPSVEPMNVPPCPWLLDPSGAISPDPSRTLSRCGAEPARPELAKAVRAERCIVGGECQIRQAREAQLGSLATSLAPRQPIGDATVISEVPLPRQSTGSPWLRMLIVVALAALITVASGPVAGAVGPMLSSIIGTLTAPSDATPTPSVETTPTASPSDPPMPSPTPSPSPSESPSPSPSPTPAASATPPKTYVVRSGDTLYDIAMSLGLGPDGYKQIAALNNIAGPAYTISPGQVLKLP